MTCIVQISDPHFGTEQPAVLAALADWVRAQAPDLLLLTGDVTQRATAAQFEAARRFVHGLGVPRVLAIPGNHDIPLFDLFTRAFDPYRRWRRAFGPVREHVHETSDCLVLMLKTTRRWRHKDGELSREQIARTAERLARAAPRQLRIVATHQPLAVTLPKDEANRLHRHAEALAAWSAAGADLVLGGHIHLPFVKAVPPLADAADGRTLWAVQAGTAVSSRLRSGAPNSVNLIRAQGMAEGQRRCTIERWDFDAATGRFTRAAAQAIAVPV